jgi:hypothetical protein
MVQGQAVLRNAAYLVCLWDRVGKGEGLELAGTFGLWTTLPAGCGIVSRSDAASPYWGTGSRRGQIHTLGCGWRRRCGAGRGLQLKEPRQLGLLAHGGARWAQREMGERDGRDRERERRNVTVSLFFCDFLLIFLFLSFSFS